MVDSNSMMGFYLFRVVHEMWFDITMGKIQFIDLVHTRNRMSDTLSEGTINKYPYAANYLSHLRSLRGQWTPERISNEERLLNRACTECQPVMSFWEKAGIIAASSALGPIGLSGGMYAVSDSCPPELRKVEDRYNSFVQCTDI